MIIHESYLGAKLTPHSSKDGSHLCQADLHTSEYRSHLHTFSQDLLLDIGQLNTKPTSIYEHGLPLQQNS